MTREEYNRISGLIVDTSVKVHQKLGPGLLESVYRKALAYELRKIGLKADEEVPFKCIYDGVDLGLGFRAEACSPRPPLLPHLRVKKGAFFLQCRIFSLNLQKFFTRSEAFCQISQRANPGHHRPRGSVRTPLKFPLCKKFQ